MGEQLREGQKLWGEWTLGRWIGSGAWGDVWEACGGSRPAVVKEVCVIFDRAQTEAARYEGLDRGQAEAYLRKLGESAAGEYHLMRELSGSPYIVECFDGRLEKVRGEDGQGMRLLMVMERLTPLQRRFSETALTVPEDIRLGIDICRAIEECSRHGIWHRDVAPKNLYYCEQTGTYKLGDFGTAQRKQERAAMPEKPGTYAPPEVYQENVYSDQSDLYQLGVILYRTINDFRIPFLPPYPREYTPADRGEALMRRYRGEAPPEPRLLLCRRKPDGEDTAREMSGFGAVVAKDGIEQAVMFARAVMKAVAPDRAKRYRDAAQFRRALELCR